MSAPFCGANSEKSAIRRRVSLALVLLLFLHYPEDEDENGDGECVCVCVVHRRRRCAAAAAVFPSLSYLLTSSDCRCSFSLMCFVVVAQTAATRDDQQWWWWLVSFAPTGNLRLCLLASGSA